MNAMNMAKTAYAASQNTVRTPRGIEYEAFARITHRLKTSAEKGRSSFGQLAQAIHENRRLWTLLAADVAAMENGLPADLRAGSFICSSSQTSIRAKSFRIRKRSAFWLRSTPPSCVA